MFSFSIDDRDDVILALTADMKSLALFTDLDIMEFSVFDNQEYMVFDLAAQNTGNIFAYSHSLSDDTYTLVGTPLLYTWIDISKREVPVELLKRLFDYARSKTTSSPTLDLKNN